MWVCPGGSVVKRSLAIAGDTGFIPGPGRFPPAMEELSPCATTTEPMLLSPRASTTGPTCHNWSRSTLEPMLCNKTNHHNEKPAHHNDMGFSRQEYWSGLPLFYILASPKSNGHYTQCRSSSCLSEYEQSILNQIS